MNSASIASIYRDLKKNVPISQNPLLKKEVNFQSHKDFPIQRWLKYREGFSVDLVNRIISELSVKGTVLDPFLGSGTSTYAAAQNNIKSYGVEINPFASFVARVKSIKYDNKFINQFSTTLDTLLQKNKKWRRPPFRSIEKIFNNDVLDDLLYIRGNIEEIRDMKSKDLAFFIWLSILEEVSNTYKEGNGIKYKGKLGYKRPPRAGSPGYEKYVSIISNLTENEGWASKNVREIFVKRFEEVIKDLKSINYDTWYEPTVISGDAKNLNFLLNQRSDFKGIDLSIFSPPYANCFDYYEIFKVELWMGNFVRSYKHLRQERKRGLVSNLNANLNNVNYSNSHLINLLEKIDIKKLWDKRIPKMLLGYFRDMEKVLFDLYSVTNNGGYVVIVVANSAYGNIVIPTDLLIANIGKTIGFKSIKIVEARKTNTSSQQMKLFSQNGVDTDLIRESLVYLKK